VIILLANEKIIAKSVMEERKIKEVLAVFIDF
jgi:hypothetical protein